MQWPFLSGKNQVRQTLNTFGGYNRNLRISEGEFYDMENMSSDHYPLLSPRKKRSVYAMPQSPQALIAKDSLCWVDGSDFVINGYSVDLRLSQGEKQLVSMGAYVIIMPDKKYINTADLSDFGSLEASFTTAAPVVFSLCDEEGVEYIPSYTQPGEPEGPENMQLWMDTASDPCVLKQWSESNAMWVTVPGTCIKISSPGIGKAFRQYDGVFLRGLSGKLTDSVTMQPLEDSGELAALEGVTVIQAKGDDYILITGILEQKRSIQNPVTVSREMPLMDFVIQRENRLWGCRYGMNRYGKVVNEIYASKLGDFRNWNCFMGVGSDSYAVSVGSDGPFTGAAVYGGYPLFWKENCVHKVFGDVPANFGIQTTGCRGVQKGSGGSLAIVNERLYYKAQQAVCVYDGSVPMEVSAALGQVGYKNARAGGHGNKYYISMEDAEGKWHLFVYDTALGMWHREDHLRADGFCSCRNGLYCIDHDSKAILSLLEDGEDLEQKVNWMVQTGALGMELPEQKYVSGILMRLSMALGARMRIFIQYDSLGSWESVGTVNAVKLRSFSCCIRPRRCDHFRLKLEGEGDVKLYSLTKTLSQGSERL